MMSVGSSRPRLTSISSREKRVEMAGTPSACAMPLRDAQRADVVGDVALELAALAGPGFRRRRKRVDRVIADEDQPGVAAAGQ